ncbi:MAG: hypothetical protein AB1782_05155 [Cyanobacteriota bacterium]
MLKDSDLKCNTIGSISEENLLSLYKYLINIKDKPLKNILTQDLFLFNTDYIPANIEDMGLKIIFDNNSINLYYFKFFIKFQTGINSGFLNAESLFLTDLPVTFKNNLFIIFDSLISLEITDKYLYLCSGNNELSNSLFSINYNVLFNFTNFKATYNNFYLILTNLLAHLFKDNAPQIMFNIPLYLPETTTDLQDISCQKNPYQPETLKRVMGKNCNTIIQPDNNNIKDYSTTTVIAKLYKAIDYYKPETQYYPERLKRVINNDK